MWPRRRSLLVPLARGHSTAFFGAVGATALKVLGQEKGRVLRVTCEEVLLLEGKGGVQEEEVISAEVPSVELVPSMSEPVEACGAAEVVMEGETEMGGAIAEEMETEAGETAADRRLQKQ